MKTRLITAASLALGLALLPGCKKPAPAKAVTAQVSPTPSPDKDAIIYVRAGQLWMMKWDGSGGGVLASRKDASFWFPSASPKGDDLIAWMSRPDGSQDVVRVRLDGRYEVLTSMGDRAVAAMKNLRMGNAPSYDSKAERIAYSYNGNIWVMSRDGYDSQTLISDGLSYSPVWSPDDKKLAYINGKNGHYDLWITDVESRDTWQVTDFQDFSVGQPSWVSEGKRVMVTRSQKDESDIVTVLADTDVPLVDADVMTKDHSSASAEMNKDGKYLAFSSARGDGKSPDDENLAWDIWSADAAGKEPKKLSSGGGCSPTWIRPTVPSSVVPAIPVSAAPLVAAAPAAKPAVPMALPKPSGPAAVPTSAPIAAAATPMPKPAAPAPAPAASTPLPSAAGAKPSPAAAAAGSAAPAASAPKPVATAVAAAPAAPAASAAAASPVPGSAAPAAAPGTPKPPMQRPVQVANAQPINGKPAPTQPPAKAPPLRVRLRVSFDPDTDELMLASLTELKKTASRVKQYSGETIEVYGPLDRTALRGRFASDDDRSKARAEQVAAALAKESGIPATSIHAQAYAPVVIGAQMANGIEVHVELK